MGPLDEPNNPLYYYIVIVDAAPSPLVAVEEIQCKAYAIHSREMCSTSDT